MSLASGTRIGHYEISAAIGAGGMGEVYRARDTRLNRDVALKVLGAPRGRQFDKRYAFGQNLTIPNYSLSGDGREFLMVREEPGGRHLNLVLNWLQGLDRRTA